MNGRKILVLMALAGLSLVFCDAEIRAAVLFSEDFSGTALPGNFEQSTGPNAVFNGANTVFPGASSRGYLRTIDDDYRSIDFSAEATVSIPGGQAGWGLVFFGMGTGDPLGSCYGEPQVGPHVYLRAGPDDFGGGGVVTTDNSAESVYSSDLAGTGTHRLQMQWNSTSQTMNFAIDQDYTSGPFVADTSFAPVNGSDNGFDDTNSRVFFGGANGAIFDDFEIQSFVPPVPPVPPTATVSVFTGGDPGEGLDMEGNFLYAVSIGTAGIQKKNTGPFNVGDVIFAHESANSGVINSQASVIDNWATPNLGATTDDDNLEFAMQSIRHGGPQPAQIALNGLTPGREYQVQMLFSESCCDRGFDVFLEGTLIADDFSPPLVQGAKSGTPTNGALVTATFTATDATANISFDGAGTTFADKNPILNAITLEDISPDFDGNIALGKPIIDGSGAYNGLNYDDNSVGFAVAHVTDGSDTDIFGQSYWLGSQGQEKQYFVLDLEDTFMIDQIDLRNTHNTSTYNDRGTGQFRILGSNDLSLITGALSSELEILAGTLSDVSGQTVITADSFNAANGLLVGEYRYLRFETISSIYGNGNVGLNEIAVFSHTVSEVPEPSSFVLTTFGLLGLIYIGIRRRNSVESLH